MNNLTTQQLSDLYVCVSTRSQDILKGYNELTVEDAPSMYWMRLTGYKNY